MIAILNLYGWIVTIGSSFLISFQSLTRLAPTGARDKASTSSADSLFLLKTNMRRAEKAQSRMSGSPARGSLDSWLTCPRDELQNDECNCHDLKHGTAVKSRNEYVIL